MAGQEAINNEQETINDEQDRNSKIRKLGEQDDIKLWEAVRSFVVEILKKKKKKERYQTKKNRYTERY